MRRGKYCAIESEPYTIPTAADEADANRRNDIVTVSAATNSSLLIFMVLVWHDCEINPIIIRRRKHKRSSDFRVLDGAGRISNACTDKQPLDVKALGAIDLAAGNQFWFSW